MSIKHKKRTGGIRNVLKLATHLEEKGYVVTYSRILNLAFEHRAGGYLGGYTNISPGDISQYFRYKEGKLSLDDDIGEDSNDESDE